jgi:hypothetical protein
MSSEAWPHMDAALYVLGKLDPGELERFQAHLEGCRQCRTELEELEGLPAVLLEAAPAEPPPPELRARTLSAVREAAGYEGPVEPPVPEPAAMADVRELRPRSRWAPLAAAAALVLVAILGVATVRTLTRPAATVLAMVDPEGGGGSGEGRFTDTSTGRTFVVEVEGLEPAPEGSFYELWAVGPQDTPESPQRVSLSTFDVGDDGRARVSGVTAAVASVYPGIGVTLEPDDGNPARTGDRVLAPAP